MTPSARFQAAIDILDQIIGGAPAEKALTTWARGSRFAGSGDRAVVRDHVFDVLRMWRSCAAFGGVARAAAPAHMPGAEPTDAGQPDMAQPDMAQPDMAQPDMGQTDMARTALRQTDIDQPDIDQPDMGQTDMAQPGTPGTAPPPTLAAGTLSGRALILGLLRQSGTDPDTVFTGQGHAPGALTGAERALLAHTPGLLLLDALDCPGWLAPPLRAALGADFTPVMAALRSRAPVFIRVNAARTTAGQVRAELAQQGITAQPHPLSPGALQITEGARKLRASAALADGRVEMQDAASQAVVDMIGGLEGARVLDFCAGGGGKALALAARGAQVFAHDVSAARMADLPARAARAGVSVPVLSTAELTHAGQFDVIVADVPCSGSGSWRRAPGAKWALTPGRLAELTAVQADILDRIAALAGPQTRLVYMTCSLLEAENAAQIDAFVARHPGWRCGTARRLTPCDGGDGFYTAQLERI